LGIEGDLSKLDKKHYRQWKADENCEENAKESFEKAVMESALDRELTAEERATFKQNFIKEMLEDCENDPDIASHWTQDVGNALENEKPVVTEALVTHINEGNEGWTAKVDEEHLTMVELKKKCGKVDVPDAPSVHLDLDSDDEELNFLESGNPPATYNAGKKVPACKEVIYKMHNQGTCGSCWAFGTLSAIDSRLCMASNGAFSGPRAVLSRGQMASCAYQGRDGCQGGNFPAVYKLLAGGGVPLGSASPKGCIPYFGSGSGQDHFDSTSKAPPCPNNCVSGINYPRTMAQDKLKIPGYSGREYGPYQRDTWQKAEKFSRKEMYENGPLPIAVMVDSRFQSYSSGIYKNGCNSKSANHVTVAYGYTPEYFETMNSWGPGWGNKGHMNMANCEIAEWSVPSATKLGNYKLPGGNPSPGPPAPGPSPPGWGGWSLDAGGNWVKGGGPPSPTPPGPAPGPAPGPPAPPAPPPPQYDDPDAGEWLKVHNYFRCIHNTGPIGWDNDVAAGAAKWADRGQMSHAKCYKIPAPRGPAGENLGMGYDDIMKVVTAWYDESPERGPRCGGHCTALLWKKSAALGCSKKNTARGNRPFYVCRYAQSAANFGDKSQGVNMPEYGREPQCYNKFKVKTRWSGGGGGSSSLEGAQGDTGDAAEEDSSGLSQTGDAEVSETGDVV
jgi:cathepsin B